MIKKIIFSFVVAVLFSGCATFTPVPEAEKELQFIETVNLDQDKVFNFAIDWFAESFVDSKEVLELKDRERGKIIGKGVIPQCFSVGPPSAGFSMFRCRVTIIIEIKENRVRTTYKDITALGKDGASNALLEKKFNDQARAQIENLQAKLVTYLSKKKNDSSW